MTKLNTTLELSADQEADAQRIAAILRSAVHSDIDQIARLLASKKDHELLGQTEFQLRDLVHQIGATALETVINDRAKKGVPRC